MRLQPILQKRHLYQCHRTWLIDETCSQTFLQLSSGMRSIHITNALCLLLRQESVFLESRACCTCRSGTLQRDIILCNALLNQNGVDSTCGLDCWVLSMTFHSAAWLIHMSCVENLVWFCSNHMVFRQNLSPLFREHIFSFAGMNFTKTSFASIRGGPCHLTMKESQPFIKGLTLNTWDLIHLPDPKVAVCEGWAWFRYLSFRTAFATLSRISGDICCGGNNVLVCKYEDAFTQHNM